jgi:flagellin
MRINTNISALNAHRQLGINTDRGANAMEKLSSGLRINRAGDDAAGLAISEKMRGQIRGLTQASRNAQDGISLIQTAEGALNETHAILQRMRELATQSSTDTNTIVDRGEIQKEINQLAEEITRIAETTEFNTQNLLGGKFEGTFHIGANEGQNINLKIAAMDSNALKVAGSGEGFARFEIEGKGEAPSGNEAATALAAGEQTLDVVGIGNITVGSDAVANYGLANADGEIVAISQDGKEYKILTAATEMNKLAGAEVADGYTITFDDAVIDDKVTLNATIDEKGETTEIEDIKATASVKVTGLEAGKYTVAEFDATTHTPDNTWTDGKVPGFALLNAAGEVVALGDENGNNFYALKDLTLKETDNDFNDSGVLEGVAPVMTTATALVDGDIIEIKADGGINVSTQEAADKAITIINDAIETVSAERSMLGAMQNRLEHTIANLGTSAENLQAAESRIRDLDMAAEIMEFTKSNILNQAATAMLAQANMAPQTVLQLLG